MDSVTLTMLVFIFICVAPGLWMGYYFGPPGLAARAKKAEEARARFLREGIQASARVLTMQMGSCIVVLDGHRYLELQFAIEVHPGGQAPYRAALTERISELYLSRVQPGAMLTVRVSPHDATKVMFESLELSNERASGPDLAKDPSTGQAGAPRRLTP